VKGKIEVESKFKVHIDRGRMSALKRN